MMLHTENGMPHREGLPVDSLHKGWKEDGIPQTSYQSEERGITDVEGFLSAVTRRLTSEGKLSPDGLYDDRHLIVHDAPINGGIFVDAGAGREAIFVDRKNSPILEGMIDQVKATVVNNDGEASLFEVFSMINNLIDEKIVKYTEVYDYLDEQNLKNDTPVSLEVFLQKGVGVCRHLSLTAAAIIEALIEENILQGRVSLERSRRNMDGMKAHAWVRYESIAYRQQPHPSNVFIVDPTARGDILSLSLAMELKDESPLGIWDYARREDYSAVHDHSE
jgi:hypothetical protein